MKNNNLIKTNDNTYTMYSSTYKQNYHNLIDGAMSESLLKHVLPVFSIFKHKVELNILDICFGLGYNTFCTILHIINNNIKTKINIYSPELDEDLIQSLNNFEYPKEFKKINHIIKELIINKKYQDAQFCINIHIGDARKYIKSLKNIDVVYQDAFSSDVNKELWTFEYFKDIKNILNREALITTYSISTPIRLAISYNDMYIFEHKYDNKRKASIAYSKNKLSYNNAKFIDMNKKLINNPNAKTLKD